MQLNLLAETYAVCKLNEQSRFLFNLSDLPPLPCLFANIFDSRGQTVVGPLSFVEDPANAKRFGKTRQWRCFQVDGVLPFDMVGIIAELTSILREAKISVFAVSSFETDYLLVFSENVETAIEAFENAGHVVQRTQYSAD